MLDIWYIWACKAIFEVGGYRLATPTILSRPSRTVVLWFSVADLEGDSPPPPLSPEIYHQMLVKLKIWDPKYVNFFLIWEVSPLLFEISGSATENDLFSSALRYFNKDMVPDYREYLTAVKY
jgi:hypothetical protein